MAVTHGCWLYSFQLRRQVTSDSHTARPQPGPATLYLTPPAVTETSGAQYLVSFVIDRSVLRHVSAMWLRLGLRCLVLDTVSTYE
eukprot:657115-Prymnesium_polylepis.1